jgi:hypothetical protein
LGTRLLCAWTGPDGPEMGNAADASQDQCINLAVRGKASPNRPLRLTWRVFIGRLVGWGCHMRVLIGRCRLAEITTSET